MGGLVVTNAMKMIQHFSKLIKIIYDCKLRVALVKPSPSLGKILVLPYFYQTTPKIVFAY